jgi:hypothetical protein
VSRASSYYPPLIPPIQVFQLNIVFLHPLIIDHQ